MYIIHATYFQSLMRFDRISCAITWQNHQDVKRLSDLGPHQGVNSILSVLGEANYGQTDMFHMR